MGFRCLFHVHTRHSLDSALSPEKILAEVRGMNVDVLIVTDHDKVAGSCEVRSMAQGNPRFTPIAAEYKTDKGDLIGVFLQEEVRAARAEDVADRIHEQGGIVILPHPYKAHALDDSLLSKVDLVEIYNARCSANENNSAKELARAWNLPCIAGADAHCAGELGAALNDFQSPLPEDEAGLCATFLRAPRSLHIHPVSGVYRPLSQIIKAWKTRNAELLLSQSKRLAVTLAREAWTK